MQFGIGILGANWDQEAHYDRVRADTRPPHANFRQHADRYAGALAAKTIYSEPPEPADLTDEGIVEALKGCVRAVRYPEAPMVREAFARMYGHDATTKPTTESSKP